MYVFVVGMERCGTHSVANIVKNAAVVPCFMEHEIQPFLCKEAKSLYENKDFRTQALQDKIRFFRKQHKTCKLVGESNHRLGYFITLLMREFAPNCKFIFLYRNPIATIISRMGIWSHYPNFIDKYPDFYRNEIFKLKPPFDFNEYRLNPPKNYRDKSLSELYAWEWIENYKFTRQELACVPASNRLIMKTEDITPCFYKILSFIGVQHFDVEMASRWSRVKSDSIYVQEKENEKDNFVTRNRDMIADESVLFARREVANNRGVISTMILDALTKLQIDLDQDIIDMDKVIIRWQKIKMA